MPPAVLDAPEDAARAVLFAALEDVAGPAIVLDRELAIVAASAEAASMVGSALSAGAPIVKLLCGDADQRPVAEALAAGRATSAVVMRPAPGGGLRPVRVRVAPVVRAAEQLGWVLLLEVDREALADGEPVRFHGMWTRDPGMKRTFHIIERAARRDVSVLVRGPTGSGKELVARAIHALSPRSAGPFQAINCAALPANLLESELFGHVKGSFTGAVKDNPGIFRAAHRGTLFLDELGEMPLELQAKLLRALETRTVIPVGSTEPVAVDVRIVAATHQSLRAAVELGRFRADLMYRLRVVPIHLSPLAERRGDVELLTDRLIEELNRDGGRSVERVARDARDALERYPWPGNVRELRNALEYAYVIGEGPVLVAADLPPELLGGEADGAINAPPALGGGEVARIRLALERAGGSRDRAAKILGISRATLWRRMREHGLLTEDGSD
jgi:transcriptional regulator with PAS, ATPase and Fis domain